MFLGVFSNDQNEHFLVTEFLSKGDLLSIIRTEKLEIPILIDMAKQAAAGMSYLHSKGIVHRDLALRNLLVASSQNSFLIKVSDVKKLFVYFFLIEKFGLSRVVGDTTYYQKNDAPIPVKVGEISVKS